MKKIFIVLILFSIGWAYYFSGGSKSQKTIIEEDKSGSTAGTPEKKKKIHGGSRKKAPKIRALSRESAVRKNSLSSDCLKEEVNVVCKKTKGTEKSTSPAPIKKDDNSLNNRNYSDLLTQ